MTADTQGVLLRYAGGEAHEQEQAARGREGGTMSGTEHTVGLVRAAGLTVREEVWRG